MEYYEILNEFISNYTIDIKLVRDVIDFFRLHNSVDFLANDNKHIKKNYLNEDLDILYESRNSFLNNEILNIDKTIFELRSLKQSTQEEAHLFIEGLINEREGLKEKILKEKEIPKEELKNHLNYRYENNRKNILLTLSKIKEIESNFNRENKNELLQKIKRVKEEVLINLRIDKEVSFQVLIEKIEEEHSNIDIDYLRSIGLFEEANSILNYRQKVTNKEEAINYLSELTILSGMISKPLNNDELTLTIAKYEQLLYSRDIFSYLKRTIDHPELNTYYVALNNLISILGNDMNSREDQETYLKIIDMVSNILDSLEEITKPLNVDKNIFEYDISYDKVTTVGEDTKGLFVVYEKDGKQLYSVVENQEVLFNELNYWKEQMNYGYDRYDKGNFYSDVEETFNFIKFYYRFKCYTIYNDILNKSREPIENDSNKKDLFVIKDFLENKVEKLRERGKNSWSEVITPDIYFSKLPDFDKNIIFETIIPKNGIGRCIGSPEMLKCTYGEEHIRDYIKAFEDSKEKL